jgi:hypothetical protein
MSSDQNTNNQERFGALDLDIWICSGFGAWDLGF